MVLVQKYKFFQGVASDTLVSMWVVLGNLDGVHVGHQQLIAEAKLHSGDVQVVSFEPHPLVVLRPPFVTLLNRTENDQWLRHYGATAIFRYDFTEQFSALSAEEFFSDLCERFPKVQGIVVGFNFRFGHRRLGDVKTLQQLGSKRGVQVSIVEAIKTPEQEVVSSSKVREYLQQGDLAKARVMLNRRFGFIRSVVRGDQRGEALLGVPTANMSISDQHPLRDGVYSSRTWLGESWQPSVTFKGKPPSFATDDVRVETHLLGKNIDLNPEQPLKVELINWIRENKKFATALELREQILRDIQIAQQEFTRDEV